MIDNVATDAYHITHVTIHPTQDDADANTNIIQTITSTGITKTATGIYEYTAAILSTSQTYYDKIFIIPIENASPISFVNSFVVAEPDYSGGLPGAPGTCDITGTIVDHNGEPLICGRVYALPLNSPVIVGNQGVYVFPSMAYTTSTGEFSITLIRGVSFNVTIKEIGLSETIRVPEQATCELWSLIGVQTQADPTPADTGEGSWS